jgi:hypothetical protein
VESKQKNGKRIEKKSKKFLKRRQIKEADEMKAFIRAVEFKLRFPAI